VYGFNIMSKQSPNLRKNAAGENLVTKMHAAKVNITMNASENIIGHEILLRNKSDRSLENFKYSCCTDPERKCIKQNIFYSK